MKMRTPEEIKAYIDGYNACYEQFCSQLKNRKSLMDVIRKMEILKAAVNNVFEDKEGGGLDETGREDHETDKPV